MTAPPPAQQEYIITEFQLKQLQDFASLDFVCQAIRSRPHTSTPHKSNQFFEPLLKCDCEVCKDARDGRDTAIAAQARDQVLDEVIQILDSKFAIRSKIESLRTQQEQP